MSTIDDTVADEDQGRPTNMRHVSTTDDTSGRNSAISTKNLKVALPLLYALHLKT